jgi:hypothetical protein
MVAGFFENGKNFSFRARILTDLSVQSGDSGTPIFNKFGEILDIVHISNFRV